MIVLRLSFRRTLPSKSRGTFDSRFVTEKTKQILIEAIIQIVVKRQTAPNIKQVLMRNIQSFTTKGGHKQVKRNTNFRTNRFVLKYQDKEICPDLNDNY